MGKSASIPPKARAQVKQRSHFRCERCGVPAPNGQWHHRRSRRVRDRHQHCPCNGVWLCGTCHRQVHGGKDAQRIRDEGWIVSQFCKQPGVIPVTTKWGVRWHKCDGDYLLALVQNEFRPI